MGYQLLMSCRQEIFSQVKQLAEDLSGFSMNNSQLIIKLVSTHAGYHRTQMVAPSWVCIYKPNEIDLNDLAIKAQAILQKKPFVWQLEIAEAVLQGEDVIVDVGTGSGKTLCFALPLLKDETYMVLVVSPLTALMVDQVRIFIQFKNEQLTYIKGEHECTRG